MVDSAEKIKNNQKNQPKSKGGVRVGAGRKRGRPDRATVEQKEGIEAEARKYCGDALKALVDICKNGESESARVTAANGLLDRGYGKPRQAVEHTGEGGGPLLVAVTHEVIDPQES